LQILGLPVTAQNTVAKLLKEESPEAD